MELFRSDSPQQLQQKAVDEIRADVRVSAVSAADPAARQHHSFATLTHNQVSDLVGGEVRLLNEKQGPRYGLPMLFLGPLHATMAPLRVQELFTLYIVLSHPSPFPCHLICIIHTCVHIHS